MRAERTVLGGETVVFELLAEFCLECAERVQVAGQVDPQDARGAGAAEVARGVRPQNSSVTAARRLTAHRLECLQAFLRLLPQEGQRDVQQRVIYPPIVAACIGVRFQSTERRLDLRGELDREEQSHLIET